MDLQNQPTNRVFTYFIAAPERADRVKIGKSKDPWKRLDHLQTASPYRLAVFATTTVPEGEVHDMFSHLRLFREWFLFDDTIVQWIEDNAVTHSVN